MAGRGPQTFQKRQKEQQRKERREEKLARRLQRKNEPSSSVSDSQSRIATTHEELRIHGDDIRKSTPDTSPQSR